MPCYCFVLYKAYRDSIWSHRCISTFRNHATHTQKEKQRHTKGLATYAHTQTHSPLLVRARGNGWDGPSTQSHSKPIKADDSSDIYTIHLLPLSHTHAHRWSPSLLPHQSHRRERKKRRASRQKMVKMEEMQCCTGCWLYAQYLKYWWRRRRISQMYKEKRTPIKMRCWLVGEIYYLFKISRKMLIHRKWKSSSRVKHISFLFFWRTGCFMHIIWVSIMMLIKYLLFLVNSNAIQVSSPTQRRCSFRFSLFCLFVSKIIATNYQPNLHETWWKV